MTLRVCTQDGAPDSGPRRVDAATTRDAATTTDAHVALDSGSDAGDGRMVTVGGCGCGASGRGSLGAIGVLAALGLVIRHRRARALR